MGGREDVLKSHSERANLKAFQGRTGELGPEREVWQQELNLRDFRAGGRMASCRELGGAVHTRSQSAGPLVCSRPGPHGVGRQTLHSAGQGPALRAREQDAGKDKFSWRFRGKHRSEL